jgi:hypothetical protein
MISKRLIKTVGIINIAGPSLYILYRILSLVFLPILKGEQDISLQVSDNDWIWLGTLQLIAMALLLFGIVGVYYLLSNVLDTFGFVSISILFTGMLLATAIDFLRTYIWPLLVNTNTGLLGNRPEFPSLLWISMSTYVMVLAGYVLFGLNLRLKKLFAPAMTMSIILGGVVFWGSNFARDSGIMVEIIGMIFLFVLGLIPLGWKIYSMYTE